MTPYEKQRRKYVEAARKIPDAVRKQIARDYYDNDMLIPDLRQRYGYTYAVMSAAIKIEKGLPVEKPLPRREDYDKVQRMSAGVIGRQRDDIIRNMTCRDCYTIEQIAEMAQCDAKAVGKVQREQAAQIDELREELAEVRAARESMREYERAHPEEFEPAEDFAELLKAIGC